MSSAAPTHSRSASGTARSNPMLNHRPSSATAVNGPRIGPYSVGKTLGVGSTGRVKLGVHIETGKRVAIKIIPKQSILGDKGDDGAQDEGSGESSAATKIEREIILMRLLRHPNLMQLYDVYESENDLYLILEHVEGGELFDYLVKKGRLSDHEALGFFQQIIYGVEFCHRHLVCHRDLKPENLLLDKDLNIKIADFGMASLQVTGKLLETSCGSPHYASPEIIKGVKYDGPPADIWSCGVILYALLTGNLPFDDDNIRRLLNKVKTGVYYIPDYVSPVARDLIKRMLTVEPSQRITMREIMSHPWFVAQKPKGKTGYVPGALDRLDAENHEPEILDPEIIANLAMLGWGPEHSITELVVRPEASIEKVFYNLLYKRKWEFFEHYDVERLTEWDVEGGPKRRADSLHSVYSEKSRSRAELFKSNDSLSPAGGARPKSREELYRSRESLGSGNLLGPSKEQGIDSGSDSERSSVHSVEQKQEEKIVKPLDKLKLSVAAAAAVKVNSPLSSSINAFDEPEQQQEASSQTSSMYSSPEKPASAAVQRHARGRSAELLIAIPQKEKLDAIKTEGAVAGSPKFHRRKIDATVLPSPIITTTPKKSWFTNLFNFKPEVFVLASPMTYLETTARLEEIFKETDIKFQPRKEGGYKCKYDGSPNCESPTSAVSPKNVELTPQSPSTTVALAPPASAVKAVKFKIELLAEGAVSGDVGEHRGWRIQFTQQQGAFSTFQAVFAQASELWG